MSKTNSVEKKTSDDDEEEEKVKEEISSDLAKMKKVSVVTSNYTKQFERDGFLILRRALTTTRSSTKDINILEEWRTFAKFYFQNCFRVMHHNGHICTPNYCEADPAITQHDDDHSKGRQNTTDRSRSYSMELGAKHGFREIVMRSPGRFEMSLLNLDFDRFQEQLQRCQQQSAVNVLIPETTHLITLLEPLLLSIFHKNNIDELKLCHLSLLVATPGSSDQSWHADGGHVSISEHLPCHCANIFIPLQDVPLEMGPTEFRPGGHFLTRNLAPMMLAAKCRKTLQPPEWLAVNQGDVVIFDYRVLHRGRANTTTEDRHILVLTFCEPWFEDILNFPQRSMLDDPKMD